MTAINAVTDLSIVDGVAVITVTSPPVNALGFEVRSGISQALTSAFGDPQAESIVLICGGRTFFAGADIREFGKPLASPVLREIALQMEASSKPVIAAIHGTALGGGLETALACHWRIADPAAKLGLPEVKLGLLAGAGGTQRLPRLVGVEKALEMVVFGEPIGAAEAREAGLVHELADGDLRSAAIRYAQRVVQERRPLCRVRDLPPPVATGEVFEQFRRRHAGRMGGFEAPESSIRAVEASVCEPFDQGMRTERRLFEALASGSQCAAQRYLFFAEREAARAPGRGDAPLPEVRGVALQGQGVAAVAQPLRAAGLVVHGIEAAATVPAGVDVILRDAPSGTVMTADDGPPQPVTLWVAQVGATPVPEPRPKIGALIRMSPWLSAPALVEVLLAPNTDGHVLGMALALAKRLKATAVVTIGGEQTIGARMQGRLETEADLQDRDTLTAQARERGIWVPPSAAAGRSGADRASRPVSLEGLICALINEGARILQEGAAARAADIDVACVKSGLWRAYLGGPMFQADEIGLTAVVATLRNLEREWGPAYRPAQLLLDAAAGGRALRTITLESRHG